MPSLLRITHWYLCKRSLFDWFLFVCLFVFSLRSWNVLLFVKHSLDLWVHQTGRNNTKWLHVVYFTYTYYACTIKMNHMSWKWRPTWIVTVIKQCRLLATWHGITYSMNFLLLSALFSYLLSKICIHVNLTSTICIFVQFKTNILLLNFSIELTWVRAWKKKWNNYW